MTCKVFPLRCRRADKRPPTPIQYDDHVNAWLAHFVSPKHASQGPAPFDGQSGINQHKRPPRPSRKSEHALREILSFADKNVARFLAERHRTMKRATFLAKLAETSLSGFRPLSVADARRVKCLEKRLTAEHREELVIASARWKEAVRHAVSEFVKTLPVAEREDFAAVVAGLGRDKG